MATYILADNEELSRFAFESLIKENQGDMVFTASDRKTLTSLLSTHKEAIVILDYHLFDFIDDNQMIITSERFSKVSWLLVGYEFTRNFLNRVIYTSHVFSVVFKDSPLSEIREALRLAGRHSRYVCQKAMEIILENNNINAKEDKTTILTVTEIEIVKSIVHGKTTKEIAGERNLSVHTISTHRKNIFRKLEINTVHELMKYALRKGWVDPAEFYI